MDYGVHHLLGVPQTLSLPQPQPLQPATAQTLSSAYYTLHPNLLAAANPPAFFLVLANGGVAQVAQNLPASFQQPVLALKTINDSSMMPEVMAHINQMSDAEKSVPDAVNKRRRIGYIDAGKIVKTFACEACNIECNSQKSLDSHNMGKKHIAILGKLQEKNTLKPSAALQAKEDKVVRGGNAVECFLCNVVCNSKAVYDTHIVGKKHLNMIKKQEENQV